MAKKLAVKLLSASDLTIFEWHFRCRPCGNQKAINLNRAVFIDLLFPSLPEAAKKHSGKLPVNLHIFGPGLAGELNIQRKIIKLGSYKNWRLDGEFIFNPPNDPSRFNVLEPNDFVIFEFSGSLEPTSAKAVFVAKALKDDSLLHGRLTRALSGRAMMAIGASELSGLAEGSTVSPAHPVHELFLDEALEDAAQKGVRGLRQLNTRYSGRQFSNDDLERSRIEADEIDQLGEELVDSYLMKQLLAGQIREYRWVSRENVLSPYDFVIEDKARRTVKVEVKSTAGDFGRMIHISAVQLDGTSDSLHDISLYRVYEVQAGSGKLRICQDMGVMSEKIISALQQLPEGATVDAVSMDPALLSFGDEISVRLPHEDE